MWVCGVYLLSYKLQTMAALLLYQQPTIVVLSLCTRKSTAFVSLRKLVADRSLFSFLKKKLHFDVYPGPENTIHI